MYSPAWFETFAPSIEAPDSPEVRGLERLCALPQHRRLLEIGCGTGRVSGPLSAAGYDVVGIDISVDALQRAREVAPGPRYVALDQRDVGQLPWTFDAAIILWNSIGFSSREDDTRTLTGIASVLRPGGKLLMDLYHPEWLQHQPNIAVDTRGVLVRRWVQDGRCYHDIRYANGTTDDIQFNVYMPDEMVRVAASVGFKLASAMTWWNEERAPSAACARYQLEFVRV